MNSANFGKIQILDYAIKNGTNLKLRDNFNVNLLILDKFVQ
jgi:hypothetical protein